MWIYLRKVYTMAIDSDNDKQMSSTDITDAMNVLGADGWEAYSTIQNKNSDLEYIVWFKKWVVEE